MITQIVFWFFAVVLIGSAVMVVSARNPVHSVLFLILAFFNAAGLFLIAGAEFLAMILVIAYVGAVAVLFLFVVMMLDVNFSQLREGLQRYFPVGAAVGLVLFVELALSASAWRIAPNVRDLPHARVPGASSNTEALGELIYTHYVFLFQACGLVLLVAMIGAIVLTLRDRPSAKRQDVAVQHARVPADTLQMMTLGLGESTTGNGGFRRPIGKSAEKPVSRPALVIENSPDREG
ncbi:NADH-quinone oxidoreductase subunit J [Lichenicoccus roseus]|uniref:NADH-quinone oxidoreductase subunit J n=1 Tax=Lichenicoccus roseus TaxID=2683649 RepID=A0A5R9J879_9PROT|nr:NADH-quinone oxidoreductase subunit J [Lichenicoccus roseus]TLU72737.1 NADH-quinone oxidoreductase subunit J [Lichenicoccus roseus]